MGSTACLRQYGAGINCGGLHILALNYLLRTRRRARERGGRALPGAICMYIVTCREVFHTSRTGLRERGAAEAPPHRAPLNER